MGVGIPSHLCGGYALAFSRPQAGGLSGWQPPESGTVAPYWTGEGYVSLPLTTRNAADESATLKGMVLFYLDPVPPSGEFPKASDQLLIDGVVTGVLSVRPPNTLIDYCKVEVRTGAA